MSSSSSLHLKQMDNPDLYTWCFFGHSFSCLATYGHLSCVLVHFSIDMSLRATFVTCGICGSGLHLVLYSSCLFSAVVFHAYMNTSSFSHGQLENHVVPLTLWILTCFVSLMSSHALVVGYLHFNLHFLGKASLESSSLVLFSVVSTLTCTLGVFWSLFSSCLVTCSLPCKG